MRIEILVLAALAAFASAAPQWPYRDAVAPYYYGYPGKTPYMYRSDDEDDEMDETVMGRQDLKVASNPGAGAGSSVTVVEDDEKADGVRVVETGSSKPVSQSSNNQQQQQLSQTQQEAQASPAVAQQAQQPLANNNANNAQAAGQPLTAQSGQQPPQAFPPARPTARPRPVEDEDEDEEEEDSEEDEEDEEDAEDEEDGDSDDEEDEEDEEDRRRQESIIRQQEGSASSEEPQVIPQQPLVQPQSSIVSSGSNSEGSDELVQEEQQPAAEVPIPSQQPLSQSAVLNKKVNKNKQNNPVVVPVTQPGGNKKKVRPATVAIGSNKNKNPGAIEALVPGYVTDQGEVLVPVDTVTGSQPITIVPDPFSPPSRIVSGPRPIPQSAVPSTPSRQVPYWYRNSPAVNPLTENVSPYSRQTFYSAAPPPGSIFTFDDDDDDDDDRPQLITGNRLRQEEEADDDDDEQDEESDEDEQKEQPKPQKVPLAAVPAIGNSGEDDEAEALAFVSGGRPVSGKRPASTSSASSGSGSASSGGNKKPAAGTGSGSDESESVEDESEEADVSDEEEEDDSARAVAVPISNNRGRMYVDEDYVSFPPSRSPNIFAVVQGRYPQQGQGQRRQPQIIYSPNPNNPNQRYVVRVTPANRGPRPEPQQSLYYRPIESSPRNRRVVPVASFDVSVEDTRPSGPGQYAGLSVPVDSDEEGESVYAPGGPTPVTSYPFVYKVQGSVQGLRLPSGGGPGGYRPSGGRPRPSRPTASFAYYEASLGGPGGPGGPRPRPPRPSGGPSSFGGPSPYGGSGGPYRNPYASIAAALYGPYGPLANAFSSSGSRRPGPPGLSDGPPVIVRRKQPGGRPDRPPKPQLIAVYDPTGSSSSGPGGPGGPRPREPVEEEYYTFERPETNNKIVAGRPRPSGNKRPTVHRKPTPVIHQKLVSEDEESSEEALVPGSGPTPHQIQLIPQGTVRRRIRGGKQLKTKKKSSKKNSSSSKKQQQQQDQQDPLGLLSKINKSNKSKFH